VSYVLAGYGITVATLAVYAVRLVRRARALGRSPWE
jgi:heme exporter protein D